MKAVDYFLSGYSCSESIVLSSIDKNLCEESLLSIATPFSGGIGSGCLCGAASGSLLVIGHRFGKNNKYGNPPIARTLAQAFMSKFKETHKVTCCRALTKGLESGTPERKQHCTNFVEFCAGLLDEVLEESVKNG